MIEFEGFGVMGLGVTFFWRAISSLWQDPAATLKVASLPLLGGIVGYYIVYAVEAAELFATIIDYAILCIVAVLWHRRIASLMGRLAPDVPRRFGFYLLEWIIIGIVIGVPVMLVLLCLALLGGDFAGDVFDPTYIVEGYSSDPYILVLAVLMLLCFVAMTTITLRISMTLPHLALTGNRLRFREGWARTRPIARALIVTAALTAVGVVVMLGVVLYLDDALYEAWGNQQISTTAYNLLLSITYVVTWVGQVMIGAGMLTHIYLATSEAPPEADKDDGAIVSS